jgi:arylsulfatase A-like enzyme
MLGMEHRCSTHGAGHYDENLRVPLIVHLPGEHAARRDDSLVRHIDIFPTVADLAGLTAVGYQGQGVSLRDVLAGRARPEFSFSEADARCIQRYGLATRRYKYIYTPYGDRQHLLRASARFVDSACLAPCRRRLPIEELYDLAADPAESQDLMRGALSDEARAALPGLRASLEKSLNLTPRYRTRLVLGKRIPKMAPELESGLRNLGYLQ